MRYRVAEVFDAFDTHGQEAYAGDPFAFITDELLEQDSEQ